MDLLVFDTQVVHVQRSREISAGLAHNLLMELGGDLGVLVDVLLMEALLVFLEVISRVYFLLAFVPLCYDFI